MNALLAQVRVVPAASWSLGEILIAVVVLAAIVAIVYAALQYFSVSIPPVVVRIFWILVVAVLAILAVKFLLSL